MKSMPASSSISANARLLSHELFQRSGILVTDMPPEQFDAKVPSRKCFLCGSGMKSRDDMKATHGRLDAGHDSHGTSTPCPRSAFGISPLQFLVLDRDRCSGRG